MSKSKVQNHMHMVFVIKKNSMQNSFVKCDFNVKFTNVNLGEKEQHPI